MKIDASTENIPIADETTTTTNQNESDDGIDGSIAVVDGEEKNNIVLNQTSKFIGLVMVMIIIMITQ